MSVVLVMGSRYFVLSESPLLLVDELLPYLAPLQSSPFWSLLNIKDPKECIFHCPLSERADTLAGILAGQKYRDP